MLDSILNIAKEKLGEYLAPNSLDENKTTEATQEGAASVVEMLQEQMSGGNLSAITNLFSKEANNSEANNLVGNIQNKLAGLLQNKGLSQEEAQQNAAEATPGLINELTDRFTSETEENKGFNINDIQNLLGGNTGNLLNKVKGLF